MYITRFLTSSFMLRPTILKIRHKNGFQACCAVRSLVLLNPSINKKYQVNYVSTFEVKSLQKEEGLLKRILSKVPLINIHKMRLKATGYVLYEEIADNVDYISFFDIYDLPDTFYSWFVVTELYIWMLSVRVMADGKDGLNIRNALVEALWRDVAQRVKKLGTGTSAVKEDIEELSEQLRASLIAYDEGIQSDDTVMAGALWRRFYKMGPVHLHNLEKLVEHVRKQIALLDIVTSDQIFKDRKVKWEPVR